MNRVKLHVHSKSYNAKPKNVASINAELTKTVSELTAKELSQLVGEEGRTAVLAVMKGKRAKDNMLSQQVLALDFDNEKNGYKTKGNEYQTIEDTLADDFIQQNASFLYKTFSHTDEHQRFRVVFMLDEQLRSNEEVFSAYQYLMNKYPNADKAPKDSSRIFFGGIESTEIDYSNQLRVKDLPKVEVKPKQAFQEIEYTANDVKVFGMFDYDTPTWKLIKGGQKEEVKSRWSQYSKGMKFEGRTEVWNFVRSLDMKELLGVQGNPFLNILKYEDNPSASIWKPKNSNTYLYTELNNISSTGNAITYDIYKLVKELAGITTMGAEQYILDVFDINFDVSEEYTRVHREAEMFKSILLSDSFKEEHPDMYQMFGRYGYQNRINSLIDIFKGNIYENEDGEIEMLTWLSVDNIAKRLGTSKVSASRLINMLALTKVITKLPDDEIPKNLLKIIETNQSYVKNAQGELVKRKTKRQYRSTVMQLNHLISNQDEIEERAAQQVKNNFTVGGNSKEWLERTYGKEVADEVFPQDTERKVSAKSNEITSVIHQVVMTEIQENGYVVINEVKEKVQEQYGSKSYTDYKYKQQEAEMIAGYGLTKRGLTNELREQFNITHLRPNARPQILLQA